MARWELDLRANYLLSRQDFSLLLLTRVNGTRIHQLAQRLKVLLDGLDIHEMASRKAHKITDDEILEWFVEADR